jgi:hypothetical protein
MTKDSTKGELRRDKIGQPTPSKDELRDDQLDAVSGGIGIQREPTYHPAKVTVPDLKLS